MPLLKWDKVTLHKADGGLGIKDLFTFIISLLGSAVLKSLNDQDIPCVQLSKRKYGQLSFNSKTTGCSFTSKFSQFCSLICSGSKCHAFPLDLRFSLAVEAHIFEYQYGLV